MSTVTYDRATSAARRSLAIDPVVVVLSLLTLVGLIAGVWRLFFGMGSTTALTDGYPWGIWIGFDFALIAFAAAGFTMTTLVYVFHQEQYRDAMRPAVLAGLCGYVAVLALLVLDLGRWDRFYHFIIYWNVHSPLFEISWCVLLYTTVLLIENSPQLFEWLGKPGLVRIIHRIVVVLVIVGLTLSSLHQSTLGTLYLNMPNRLAALWYSPILSLLFFVSSVMAGLSIAMVAYMAAVRLTGRTAKPAILSGLATGVAWATLLYVVLKLGDLLLAGELPAFFAFDRLSWLMWLELGVFAVLPMTLFFIPALRNRRSVQWIGVTLILCGILLNRFNATLFAQLAPAGASYSPHPLEWLSTLGVLAAAVLAWYLGVRYLPMFSDAHPER
jgi:Ni/Fe-hydrogenase subunit HybB-like protein